MVGAFPLYADHIHMALEGDGWIIFISLCCRDLHYYVAYAVAEGLDPMVFGPGEEVLSYSFLVSAFPRNGGDI